jgi:hypothetical protein
MRLIPFEELVPDVEYYIESRGLLQACPNILVDILVKQ